MLPALGSSYSLDQGSRGDKKETNCGILTKVLYKDYFTIKIKIKPLLGVKNISLFVHWFIL